MTTKKMEVKLETVTPQRAAELLAKNVANNRHITPARVEQYATLMKDDNFLTTPEGIIIDENGRLIDGQHRLSAVVLSGKTIKMHVWYNVPAEQMRAINTGAARTLADVLTVTEELGITGAPKIAVARANAITLILNPKHNTKKLTIEQYERVREKFGEDLQWSMTNYPNNGGTGTALGRKARSVMVMGALVIAHKKYTEEIETFARKVDTGLELVETDPAYALRRFLDGSNITGDSVNRLTTAYATFRCAYAALKHEKISVLRTSLFTTENPEFAKILRFFGVPA